MASRCGASSSFPHQLGQRLVWRQRLLAAGEDGADDDPTPLPDPSGGPEPEVDPDRRLVIQAIKAWTAAGEACRWWLATVLFARHTAPREVAVFVAGVALRTSATF